MTASMDGCDLCVGVCVCWCVCVCVSVFVCKQMYMQP
jgi:hypothetical protein